MNDQVTGANPVSGELWMKTAMWWLSGVVTAVLLILLLPEIGVEQPIAAGIGFGAHSVVSTRAQIRFTCARYGVEILPLQAFLWALLGCGAALGIVYAVGGPS